MQVMQRIKLLVTRQSRTGVLIYVNKAPIVWYSKKQNSIESSSFGSEFMALKTGVELLEGLIYELQMIGVSLLSYFRICLDEEVEQYRLPLRPIEVCRRRSKDNI